VCVLDDFDLIRRDPDRLIGQSRQASAMPASEGNGGQAEGAGLGGSGQDVWRVATGGDSDEDVAWLGQCGELLGKYAVVAAIVGPSSEHRQIVGQRHDAERGRAASPRPLGQIAGKVGRGRGAATVTDGKDDVALRLAIEQHSCDVLESIKFDGRRYLRHFTPIFAQHCPQWTLTTGWSGRAHGCFLSL
jgi:hypothetical protein